MTSASSLITRARRTLIDTSATTWDDTELLDYLQMGVNEACALLLDLYVTTETVALEPGLRQQLPEGALILIDAPTNGDGGPVTQQAMTELQRVQAEWGNATPGQPAYFAYDQRSQLTYLVFPPASSGASLELVLGAMPPSFGLSDEIPISAWFDKALWAYVVGMALTKNTVKQDLTKSGLFMGMFNADMDRWAARKTATVSPPDLQGAH